MHSGHLPFYNVASLDDPYYRLMNSYDSEAFWVVHQRGKPEGYYSREFKNLINSMLS